MSDNPNFGEKEFPGVGFPTPVSIPDDTACRTLKIPASGDWQAVTMGALLALTYPENWQQLEGGISRDDAAAAAAAMIQQAYDDVDLPCPVNTVDTPFWDDASDVGDEADKDTQIWYGEVTNPTDPPGELTFEENALVWVFTGLLAIATPEVGFAPAIAFHTLAPKFILAQKRGDIATFIRIILNGQDMVSVDTSDYSPGDLIEIPVVGAEESEGGYDLLVLNYLP